ncbi:MAG TPA: permease, partial [Bacillota bacterium]|nr:permease [Bacillota bacterium]
MGVTALSLPSMIMLKRVVKTKLLAVFFGVVAIGIVIIGYVFNAMGYLFL